MFWVSEDNASDLRVLALAQYEAPWIEQAALFMVREKVRGAYRMQIKTTLEFYERAVDEAKREEFRAALDIVRRAWKDMNLDLEGDAEVKHCAELVARRRA